ncbi:stage II sporulation protein B [Bacillus australimaris]|uniref:SPOR domain-containing protein n=2 Tax=Bacillus australimaris TaxID=1326968 RepID=A0ABD4QEC9_9BACI|nr:stage II sporulation protein B [Bacillus australimaris]MBR8688783.1 SPOR domain-containing protein [Bacillus australimaris]
MDRPDEKIGEHFFSVPTKVLFFFLIAMLKCETERRTGYIRTDSLDKKVFLTNNVRKRGMTVKKRQSKKQGLKVNINGKEEMLHEDDHKPLKQQEDQVTFSNWEEKRQSEQETAASQEDSSKPKEEDFQWDDAADHIYHSDPKVVTPYQKKKGSFDQKFGKNRGPFKRVMTTIVFAVVLGTGLGVFALSLSKDGTPTNPSGGDISVSASGNETSMKAGGDTSSAGTTDESKENKDEKSASGHFSTFVVQAGKFSSEKGADELVGSLKEAGYAGKKVSMDDGYYVIAGLATEQGMTSAVGKKLIDQHFEAWGGKELSFQVPDELISLIEKASVLSSKVIAGDDVDQKDVTQLISELESAKTMDAPAKSSLLKAVQLLNEPTAENGWKSQQALLDQLNT